MKYAIYPYLDKFSLLVGCIINQKKYNITTLINPNALSAKDPGFDNVLMTTSFDEAVKNVDAVIFLDNKQYKDTLIKIKKCIRSKTDAVCCIRPKEEDLSFLTELAQENDVTFTLIDEKDKDLKTKITGRGDLYHTQECVVAAVGSLFNGGAGFDSDLVLKLAKSFEYRGYKPTIIASDRNFKLCGFYSALPFGFNDLEESPDSLVYLLNNYYNYVQMVESSDIIILQLPQEGLLKLFENFPCGFGIKTFIISRAIDIDYFTLAAGVDCRDDDVFDEMSELIKKRFGFRIDSIALNSCYVDYNLSLDVGKTVSVNVPEKIVRETVEYLENSKKSDIVYVNCSDDYFSDTICDDCIEKLSSD